MKYRKKPVVVEASQWMGNGSHPLDNCETYIGSDGLPFQGEGKVVRYFRRPDVDGSLGCISSMACKFSMHHHGWIDTPEGGHTVCPGDWIITGVRGEHYPCKPMIFEETYELEDKNG